MSDTVKQKKRWFKKAELLVLLSLVVLWIVDLKTHCVPRAAAGALRQVVKAAPDCGYAHELLSDTYTILGRDEDADEALNKAETIYSIKSCKKAVRSKPNETQTWINMGDAYASGGRYEDAIQDYKQAEKLDPNLPWIKICLALTYKDMQRYDDAVEAFKQVIKLEPDIIGIYLLLGDTYCEANEYEEAIAAYQQVIEAEPDRAQAHYNLAKVYLKVGNKDLALEQYEILKTLHEGLGKELLGLIEQ